MLRKVRFFSPLSHASLRQAARVLDIEYFPPNTVIFRQGDPGDKFYSARIRLEPIPRPRSAPPPSSP